MFNPGAPSPPPNQAWRAHRRRLTQQVVAILARFIDDDHRHLPIGRTRRCQPGIAYPGLPRALAPGPAWLMHEVVSLHLPAIRQEEDIGAFAFHQQRPLMMRSDLRHPFRVAQPAIGHHHWGRQAQPPAAQGRQTRHQASPGPSPVWCDRALQDLWDRDDEWQNPPARPTVHRQ